MSVLRRGAADSQSGRTEMVEELQRSARRAMTLSLAAPLLLFGGLGVGKVTTRLLALPEGTPVRLGLEVPTIELRALSRHMEALRGDGERTADYVVLYQEYIAPVEKVLQRRGVPGATAREIAWPLVEHAYRRGLDPATVTAILLVESSGRPRATSPVGARGLMQVMPMNAGQWPGCGRDLYDIEDNLCHGTSILAWFLRSHDGNEREGLLGYNGCINGTNTPNCWQYPDKVQRLRRQIRAELRSIGGRVATAAGAP